MAYVAPEWGWKKVFRWGRKSAYNQHGSLAGINLASIEKRDDPGHVMQFRVSVLS